MLDKISNDIGHCQTVFVCTSHKGHVNLLNLYHNKNLSEQKLYIKVKLTLHVQYVFPLLHDFCKNETKLI